MLIRSSASPVALVLIASCTDPGAESGVGTAAEWELGPPTVTIGSVDGVDDAFTAVRSLVVDEDDRVLLLLPQEGRVAVFSDDGTLFTSIGRPGEGPGEFTFPTDMGVFGDTLWVIDPRAGRISYFADWELLGNELLNEPRDVHPERRPRAVGVARGGGVVLVTDSQAPLDPAVTSVPSLILRSHESGLDTLATYSTDNTAGFITRMSGGSISMMRPFRQPFTHAGVWAISPDATHLLLVDQIQAESSDAIRDLGVTMLRMSGETVYSGRHAYEPIPMLDDHVGALVDELRRDQFTVDEVLEALFVPPHYPPITSALVARDGLAWVAREDLPDQDRVWMVFSSEGDWIADVVVPSGFDLRAASGEHVWGLRYDELDVVYVEKRPILGR